MNQSEWISHHKKYAQPAQSVSQHLEPIDWMPGVAPMTRVGMRTKTLGSTSTFPAGAVDLSDAETVRLANKLIAYAAVEGTLPELPAALAASFGITDRKGIKELWRHFGAKLGEAEREILRREEERHLASITPHKESMTFTFISAAKKAKKSKQTARAR